MIISRSTKLFLVAFSLILFAITGVAIWYKKNDVIEDKSKVIVETGEGIDYSLDNLNNSSKGSDGAKLEDTYSQNGLSYEYVESEQNGIKITLLEFSGLSNTNVQDKINTELKERVKKILDSNNFKNNSDSSAYVTTSVEANFSDVLSIKIFVKFTEDFNKCYGLNYRLDTGENLKFGDLFVYNTPKRNIITAATYRTFAMNYYTGEGMGNEFYTNIEGDVLNYLEDYNRGKITEFTFSQYSIELYREGKTVIIDMLDNYKYIDIYKEFVSGDSLYDGTVNVVKNIPIFAKRPRCMYDLYEKVNDQCYIDVIIYTEEELSTKEKKTVENYKKDFSKKLEVIRSEKNVYYSNYIKVTRSVENDENVLVFTENECYATAGDDNFKEVIYNVILAAERDKENINYSKSKIYFLDDSLLEESVGKTVYSVITGEEYVEPEPEPEPVRENTTNTVNNTTNTTVVNSNNSTNTTNTNTTNSTNSNQNNNNNNSNNGNNNNSGGNTTTIVTTNTTPNYTVGV